MKKKQPRFNLTVIDKLPEIKNFIYRGISSVDKLEMERKFHAQEPTVKFAYEDGEVHLNLSNVHSMVFGDYLSLDDEEAKDQEDRDG